MCTKDERSGYVTGRPNRQRPEVEETVVAGSIGAAREVVFKDIQNSRKVAIKRTQGNS